MIGNGLRTCVSDEDLAKNVGDALEGVARPRNPWLAQLLPTYHERRRRHIGQLHDDGSETGGVLPGCYGWSLFCMWCCLLKVSNFQERASSIRVKNSPDELHVRSDVGFESLCSSVAWTICGRKSSIAGNTCSPSSGRWIEVNRRPFLLFLIVALATAELSVTHVLKQSDVKS